MRKQYYTKPPVKVSKFGSPLLYAVLNKAGYIPKSKPWYKKFWSWLFH